MTQNKFKRLSRLDLLEMILELNRENETLREQLSEAQLMLNSREIEIKTAGSIAEAALCLNGVFEAAQAAADQYLENIRLSVERSIT